MAKVGSPERASEPFDRKIFLKRQRLKEDQVRLFAMLSRELQEAWRRSPYGKLSAMPEYTRFITAAYACGFVCEGFSADGNFGKGATYDRALAAPRLLQDWSLQTIRHLTYTIVRGERWNFEVVDDEVGVVRRALDAGLVGAVAARLESILGEGSA